MKNYIIFLKNYRQHGEATRWIKDTHFVTCRSAGKERLDYNVKRSDNHFYESYEEVAGDETKGEAML